MIAHTRFYRFFNFIVFFCSFISTISVCPAIVFCRWLSWGEFTVISRSGKRALCWKNLKNYPDCVINLELEPEPGTLLKSGIEMHTNCFKKIFADQSLAGRIEYVNPSYGQSYLYNISGESVIRQFIYGVKKLKQHFPSAKFDTYYIEEPCFTSALPQILMSLGFKRMHL
jgi:hypothetical protein